MNLIYANVVWQLIVATHYSYAADDDYNIVDKDGSFQFGYTNPDSYHFADGNRNNVVRGKFGGRNPKSGGIDETVYTAGPRGFRPRGKNIYRKYNLNQNGPRPIGSRDDPYYDPYEDPSYNFAFRTRTYSRQETANRASDVTGRYTYLDDVGERHNVEYIAGKNTGFHVKTPFPDSNTRAYGPLYFRGRGRPLPRGRTSIQRGLDGSYKFVSAGPDQRRSEVSDSTGHVRGSYTYLDDKGVQHSVHYIAGPETGYRVLKTVKGPHLPTIFPFETPDIIPPDFYGSAEGDVFDTAASGRPFKPGGKSSRPSTNFGNALDVDKEENDGFKGEKKDGTTGAYDRDSSNVLGSKPALDGSFDSFRPSASRPGGFGLGDDTTDEDESSLDFGDVFGDRGSTTTARPINRPTSGRPTGIPTITTLRPTPKPGLPLEEDDGSYKPEEEDYSFNGYAGGGQTTDKGIGSTQSSEKYPSGGRIPPSRPISGTKVSKDNLNFNFSTGFDYEESNEVENSGDIGIGGTTTCTKCLPAIVRNLGNRPFKVPPGGYARAHVQSIDLFPLDNWKPTPSSAYKSEKGLKREQLNEAVREAPESKKVKTKHENASDEFKKSITTSLPEEKISKSD